MLVLTRKTREQIQIGENVVITILKVKGQTVRVGIEAPRDVRVLRSELPKTEAESVDDSTPDEIHSSRSRSMESLRTTERNSRRDSSTGLAQWRMKQPVTVARPAPFNLRSGHCHAAAVRVAVPPSTLG